MNDLELARQKILDLDKQMAVKLSYIENMRTDLANRQSIIENLQKELATETDNAFKEKTALRKEIRALEKEINDKDFKGTLADDKIKAMTHELESFKKTVNK